MHLTDVTLCERGTVARLLYSLYTARTLIYGTASWRQAAAWLREEVYASATTNSSDQADVRLREAVYASPCDQVAADFLADFLAVRSEMGTLAASWPVFNSQIERAVLMLVLFASGCHELKMGCEEVTRALDAVLK